MQIVKHQADPGLIPLHSLKDVQPYTTVFEYDGHLYSRISKTDSQHTQAVIIGPHGEEYTFAVEAIPKSRNLIPIINLRSMTVRAIRADELVRPVRAEVHTFPIK